MSIECFHIMIGGFTQSMGTYGNGVDGLYREIHQKYSSPSAVVWYLPWYCDVSSYAEFIFRTSAQLYEQEKKRPRVQLAGYSFGGTTAVNLASEMQKRNHLSVDRLTLCDAVKRRGKGPLGWLSASNPFAKIMIPDNVLAATAFVQKNPRWRFDPPFFFPRGHDIESSAELLDGPHTLLFEHQYIDNAQQFRDKVLEDAESIHSQVEAAA